MDNALTTRRLMGEEREAALAMAGGLPPIPVSDWTASDIEMIGDGAMTPLTGFMCQRDYLPVVRDMRLSSGAVWPLPVTLAVDDATAGGIRVGDRVSLTYDEGDGPTILAILTVEDKYRYDKLHEVAYTYGTTSMEHPGVRKVMEQGEVLLGGTLDVLNDRWDQPFQRYRLTPTATRALFKAKGWNTVVGFQTRNPIHRAHEYIQKCAMEICDGILIHPLVGRTKGDDVPPDVRMASYEAILENHYPRDRVCLSVLPAAMRYGGPREAVFHALVRRNYGCTHFIVGRDHAGVGNFYGTYDAQLIFDNFTHGELGITPLMFEHAFYCMKCGNMASSKTCPHDKEHHLTLSGTRVREMLAAGQAPPPEFTRPEVAEVLMRAYGAKQA